jgi:hypothetical protein
MLQGPGVGAQGAGAIAEVALDEIGGAVELIGDDVRLFSR